MSKLRLSADLGFGSVLDGSYELNSNKTTDITDASTDIEYPSAKAVFTALTTKADSSVITALSETISSKADVDAVMALDDKYTELEGAVKNKADSDAVTGLSEKYIDLTTKVNGLNTAVGELSADMANKADISTLDNYATVAALDGKADADTVTALNTAVDELSDIVNKKADAATVTNLTTRVDGLDVTVGGKADKATTLAGYGISDSYTQTQINTKLSDYATTETLIDAERYSNIYTILSDSQSSWVSGGVINWGTALATNSENGYIGGINERTRLFHYNSAESELTLQLPEVGEDELGYFSTHTQSFILRTVDSVTLELSSGISIATINPTIIIEGGQTIEIRAFLVNGLQLTENMQGRSDDSLYVTTGVTGDTIAALNEMQYYYITYNIA